VALAHIAISSTPDTGDVPDHVRRLVGDAARRVKVLAALTPTGAQHERARLVRDLTAGRAPVPRWSYARVDHADLRRALDAAERSLGQRRTTALGALFSARLRELSIEAALCASAGSSEVALLARERYRPLPAVAAAASRLCASWLAERPADPSGPLLASDDPDPRSLLSRMRDEVGRLRLPFRVVVSPSLAPLAAIGDSTIVVAAGRLLSEEDAIRTVLHEVRGHAHPRARSRRAGCVLFEAGTARGVDDQEGRALLLEERAGLLGPHRRRMLAARHHAVQAMVAGAAFGDVARSLWRDQGFDAVDAVVVAERAFRGGDGSYPGLGRERVYLESLVRVRAHLAVHPDDEPVLASGQISIESVATLRPFAPTGN
jgi:hypothetical protein